MSLATYEQIFCLDKQRQEQVAFFPFSLHLVQIGRSFQTILWLGSRNIQDDNVISLGINISKIIVCLIMLFGIIRIHEQSKR